MSSPRWIIDDTSKPGRIFCEHTERPRLIGELVPEDKPAEDSLAIPAPGRRWLSHIHWREPSGGTWYEEGYMYDSLEAALKTHAAAKSETKAAINRRTPKRGPA